MKKLIILYLFLISIYGYAQNVGIGTNQPSEKLDVNGNINYTGNLKVNGAGGQPGQVLGVSASGDNTWVDIDDYKYSRIITSTFSTFFFIPAGVTRVMIEQWGAGGGGALAGGGASGTYARYLFDATLVSSFQTTNGVGGAGASSGPGIISASTGGNSTIVVNLKTGSSSTYTTYGGFGAGPSVGQPRVPVTYGSSTVLLGHFALPGNRGKISTRDVPAAQTSGGYHYGGDGGDAVMGIAMGGNGTHWYLDGNNTSASYVISEYGNGIFSSGGGGGIDGYPITKFGATGGNGFTVIRW